MCPTLGTKQSIAQQGVSVSTGIPIKRLAIIGRNLVAFAI